MYVVLCLIVFGCQYQCNWLPGKTRLRYDLLCVEWDVKPYTLTHSSFHSFPQQFISALHILSISVYVAIQPLLSSPCSLLFLPLPHFCNIVLRQASYLFVCCSVIFVNENENGEKWENNEFVNENEKMMKTKTKLKRKNRKRLKTKTKKLKTKMTKVLAYNMPLTGATAVRHWIRD